MSTVPPSLSPTIPASHNSRQAETRTPDQQNERDLRPPTPPLPFRFQSGLAGPGGEGAMGKNQAYKAMQRARLGSSSGAPGAADAPEDGMVGPLPLSSPSRSLIPTCASESQARNPSWSDYSAVLLVCYIIIHGRVGFQPLRNFG